MKKIISYFLCVSFLFIISSCTGKRMQVNVIPEPVDVKVEKDVFHLSPSTKIWIKPGDREARRIADYLVGILEKDTGLRLQIEEGKDAADAEQDILLSTEDVSADIGEEGYLLEVKKGRITLKAQCSAGLFYGVQTLRQLMPIEKENGANGESVWTIPGTRIMDKPRFRWRGMHLDVCRHFMPADYVKKYIDYLAMHKMNVFHWHLTEDQGWRIEIKKYPKLTEVGAWRKETLAGHHREMPPKFDGKKHGGFYTQEQIQEIVAYANSRFVTVVPEIEMPGHSLAALTAYPQYSCTGGPFEVRTTWGIEENVYCAGKEETFVFLQDVLTEVVDLFPSEYIHIGGDECPKAKWRACLDCQTRIKIENLKDEHELQSYFIKRIEKFLDDGGRKLVGWDEILEGGLAPDATVMSWRGVEGGIEAAKQGHDVVMTPISHCYFNLYQGDPAYEPLAFGGDITLHKVYFYEPVPDELSDEEAGHILGAQGNIWTEYITSPEEVEYMALPRMAALAEVVWSPVTRKDWHYFTQKMEKLYKKYAKFGIQYSSAALRAYPVPVKKLQNGELKISFETRYADADIRYTIDGSEPGGSASLFESPFVLAKTALVKAGLFRGEELLGDITAKKFYVNKATARPVEVTDFDGESLEVKTGHLLTDGEKGTIPYGSGIWLAIEGENLIATIDLGTVTDINEISTSFLKNARYGIYLPEWIEFSVSENGIDFQTAARIETEKPQSTDGPFIEDYSRKPANISTRYIRVKAKNYKLTAHRAKENGNPTQLFMDEIMVD